MRSFCLLMFALAALGCGEAADGGGGALATPETVFDAGSTSGDCQTLCDYDGCRNVCADPTAPVTPVDDPYAPLNPVVDGGSSTPDAHHATLP